MKWRVDRGGEGGRGEKREEKKKEKKEMKCFKRSTIIGFAIGDYMRIEGIGLICIQT